jgi:glycine/D-amino acid oxidase-like deaminating enzyme
VTAFHPLPRGVRVHTGTETLTCDILVVAAGSWLPKLVPDLPSSLVVERRVIAWFPPRLEEPLTDGRLPIFCLDADGGWYGMPSSPENAWRRTASLDASQIVGTSNG